MYLWVTYMQQVEKHLKVESGKMDAANMHGMKCPKTPSGLTATLGGKHLSASCVTHGSVVSSPRGTGCHGLYHTS